MELNEVDDDVSDEGPTPRVEEDDEDLPPDHAFLEEHTLTAQREDITKRLNPIIPSPWMFIRVQSTNSIFPVSLLLRLSSSFRLDKQIQVEKDATQL